MRQKTVVQLLDFVPNSWRSMEQFLISLAIRLKEQGWQTVHVFGGEPSDEFRERLAVIGSPYFVTTFPLTPDRVNGIVAQVKSFQPDVIQSHFLSKFDVQLRSLKHKCGARLLVVTDHSSGSVTARSVPLRLVSRLRTVWAAGYVDQIIAVSGFIRARSVVDQHFPASKVSVVYNGVDQNRYVPGERPANSVFTMGFVGQLIPEKGVMTLLRAMQRLVDQDAAVHLLIAGQGKQEAELKGFCAANKLDGHVEFLGQIDWVADLFRSVDLVVVPSEWAEAFGFVAAEAAACGACLLVSDAGALPEIVGQDEQAGMIFARGAVSDLVEKIELLRSNPAKRAALGANARKRAVDHFSIAQMVDGYVAYFQTITVSRD